MLVGDMLRRLVMMGVVVWLLRGVWVVRLRLKLRDLHTKPLVGLATIHDDMLLLMCLTIHGERIEASCLTKRRRSRRGRGFVVEFQSSSRGACAVADKVTLVLLRLKEVLPGPRLLEPVGTICHLTWQTRPCVICVKVGFEVNPNSEYWRDGRGRSRERSRGSNTFSPSL